MHPRYNNPNRKGELKVTCSLEGTARRVAHLIVICVYTRRLCLPLHSCAPLYPRPCTVGLLTQSRTSGFPAWNAPWASHLTLCLCQCGHWHLGMAGISRLPQRVFYSPLLHSLCSGSTPYPQLVPTSGYLRLFGVCRACYWLPLPSSGSLLRCLLLIL